MNPNPCRSCHHIQAELDAALLQVEKLREMWESERTAVKTITEMYGVAHLQNGELAAALEKAHPRIGRPRHCGKDGCDICGLLERCAQKPKQEAFVHCPECNWQNGPHDCSCHSVKRLRDCGCRAWDKDGRIISGPCLIHAIERRVERCPKCGIPVDNVVHFCCRSQ